MTVASACAVVAREPAQAAPRQARLCVAFPMLDGAAWTSGLLHIFTLVRALHDTYGEEGVRAIAFGNEDPAALRDYARTIGAAGATHYTFPRRGSIPWARNWLSRHLRQQDASVEAALEADGVNVVFSMNVKASYRRVATLFYLPDFQHIALPDMFDPAERAARTAWYMRSIRLATRVLLLSESVRHDFRDFAPQYVDKVRVVKPVSYVPQEIFDADPAVVLRMYDLPEKFVYLPNQFWKHKNHEVVLRAVELLKRRGVDVRVVCTGNLTDHRHPLYAAQLLHTISAWGLREHVICLGLVPREHVLLLIRQSVCVLNPSWFEGWGYSVDEARSLGKRLVVSDIPAHREQEPPLAVFFDPGDAEQLAACLREVWLENEPGPDPRMEAAARQQLEHRRRAYAEQFVATALDAADALPR